MKNKKDPYELCGTRGCYFWRSPTSGVIGIGSFKTKREAREAIRKYLNSF